MTKQTFIEFLMEVDAGDIELARQGMQNRADNEADAGARDQFKNEMAQSPNKGDVIQANSGNYIVQDLSREGTVVKQLNTGKIVTLPHGTKFQMSAKSGGGKPIFQVVS